MMLKVIREKRSRMKGEESLPRQPTRNTQTENINRSQLAASMILQHVLRIQDTDYRLYGKQWTVLEQKQKLHIILVVPKNTTHKSHSSD